MAPLLSPRRRLRLHLLLLLLLPTLSFSAPSSDLIRNACNATRHLDLCESSFSNDSVNLPPDATVTDVVLAAIDISTQNVITAKSKAEAVDSARAPPNINRTMVAESCIEVLKYSQYRLGDAARALSNGSAATLTDAIAWVSAALGYQHGCWSGLKNVNDTSEVADALSFISNLSNLTSNALSMMAALQRHGEDLSQWGPPQTERDGYWAPLVGEPSGHMGTTIGVPPGLISEANATVCKAGCQFRSIQDAVDAAPENGRSRFVIYIKEGVYKAKVRVGYNQTNVVFIGDGMGKTVITGSLNVRKFGVSTYNTATVGVMGDGFMMANLSIRNTAGPSAHQAVAFRSSSDRSIVEHCELAGYQDTLYAHSLRQLYKSCVISGTIDFIFGDAAAFFQNNIILVVESQGGDAEGGGETNVVTAQSRVDPAESTGFVFYHDTINCSAEYMKSYEKEPEAHVNYLGRPWRAYSRAVLIECWIGGFVKPEGWSVWIGEEGLSTLFYGEFGSRGPGGGGEGRVEWSSRIAAEHVVLYSVENFIQVGTWEKLRQETGS